jgi:hypothetical protein
MGKYTPERREEKFALMRARMEQLREIHERAANGLPAAPASRPMSESTYRRRERLKAEGFPAHLEMYRVNEVAQMLGVNPRTVVRWFGDRAVVVGMPKKTGSRRRQTLLISRRDLEEWIEEHRQR